MIDIYNIFTQKNGVCKPCSEGISSCSECESGSKCTKCLANFFLRLSDSKCYATCQANIEFSQGNAAAQTGTCVSCIDSDIANCQKCSSKSSCQECAVGYYTENPTTVTLCKSCSVSVAQCSECQYKSSKVVCSKCNKGYFLNTTTGSCTKCSDNCLECDENRCLVCEANMLPLAPLFSSCVLCKPPLNYFSPK